jgi:hypothetical protein
MKKIFLLLFLILSFKLLAQTAPKSAVTPSVNNVELGEKDNDEIKRRREEWIERAHRTPDGISWRSIEAKTKLDNYFSNLNFRKNRSTSLFDYANNLLCGTWEERGSRNQAGRCVGVDYDTTDNRLYTLSNDGGLFSGRPDSAEWHPSNDQLAFKSDLIKVIKTANSNKRIIAAAGLNIAYSDDDGLTFNTAGGIVFPIDWGGNYIHEIESVTDPVTHDHTLFLSTRPWDSGPWAPRFWLYASTDDGDSWQQIYTFNGGNDDRLRFCKPYGEDSVVYALTNEGNNSKLFALSGSTNVNVIGTSSDLPPNARISFVGNISGATTTFYVVANGTDLYKSVDFGNSWTLVSALPTNAGVLCVSPNDANKLFIGAVEAYRSYDGGLTWTMINTWGSYYASPQDRLHADIFRIKYFNRADGSTFMIINCDGGCYRSDDDLLTVTNLGLHDLNVSEYYSVVADPQTNIFLGSQDQGFQRALNTQATPGPIDFTQVVSGDYGKLQLTRNGQSLWTQYPGGNMYFYYNSTGSLTDFWSLPGSTLPSSGWMLATAPLYPVGRNQIYLAGGNMSGNDGSYLIKLTGTTTIINPTQINFDFRQGPYTEISAIGTTPNDQDRIYVATEDGRFYTSRDAGVNWTLSAGFTGPSPQYLFGNAIYALRKTSDLVFLGGNGYSNPPVYASNDGGANFIPMSNGLPPTLIFGMTGDKDENFIYGATEAGPYVFSFADSTWYPIGGGIAPALGYWSVNYDTINDVAHFSTFGRGVWDFKVCSTVNVSSTHQNEQIKIGPNPFISSTTVQFNNEEHAKCEFTLYDIQGRVVRAINELTTDKFVLERQNLRPGIYFYQLKKNRTIIGNGKLILEAN